MTVRRLTMIVLTVIWIVLMLSTKTEDLFDYFEFVMAWVFFCGGMYLMYQN